MQGAIFIGNFMLCSLLFCLSYGTPPKENISLCYEARSDRYSLDEELFIINEMRRYPSQVLPIWGTDMWNKIAKNHCKMQESNPVFPPRTGTGLARYFQKKMLNSKGNAQLPDDLLKRMPEPRKKNQSDHPGPSGPEENEHQNVVSEDVVNSAAHPLRQCNIKAKYTSEEDEFIFKFAKNHLNKPGLFGNHKLWMDAAEQHKKMRKSDPAHFPQERSSSALREHFRRVSHKYLKKGHINTDLTTEYEEMLDAAKVLHRYSAAEDNLIIEELLKPTCTSIYSESTWKTIKEQHDIKVQSKTAGFDQYRSVGSLKKRFVSYRREPLPPALKQKFPKNFQKTRDDTSSELNSAGETSRAPNASDEDPAVWEMSGETPPAAEGEEGKGVWDDMVNELIYAPCYVNFDSLKDQ